MRRTLKSNQRLIESIRLPVGLRLTPITGVAREPEQNFMTTNVLSALVCITAARSWGADERQSDRLIIRFVRSIFAISQNRHAIRAALVGEIDPLMRGDLELSLLFIWTLDGPNVPVVSRQIGRGAERKCRFQICFLCLPLDHVTECDAI